MSETISLPSFAAYGYDVIRELGHNRLGGRQTFLAHQSAAPEATRRGMVERVVIKQFQFAQSTSNWQDYRAHEAEVEILKQLDHPGIPRYVTSFETPDGFCMVQEYKDAPSLAEPRSWTPETIKRVAIALLDILVYLQSRSVPVIHRDIKPENILVDDQQRVYLVDFGFAHSGGEDLAASSLVKGTVGFMPPEQLFNRNLTTASDLYSLGATLICLITGIRSGDIGSLILADYHIRFREMVPPLHRGWLNWLEKLVQPNPADRYPSAKAALLELRPLDVSRAPKLKVDRRTVELQASRLGEPLQQTITLTNSIPDTHLSGRWEVAPHPNDPPHTPDSHPWIQVSPQYFEGNSVTCQIQVDTRCLEPGCCHRRELKLQTNATQGVETVSIVVHSAPLPSRLPYGVMAIAAAVSFLLGYWLFVHPSHSLRIGLVLIPVLFATADFALTGTVHDWPMQPPAAITYILKRMMVTSLFAFLGAGLGRIAVMVLASLLFAAAQEGVTWVQPLLDGLGAYMNSQDFVQIDAVWAKVGSVVGALVVWLIGLTGWSANLQKVHNDFVELQNQRQAAQKPNRFGQIVIGLYLLGWGYILFNMILVISRNAPEAWVTVALTIGAPLILGLPILLAGVGLLGLERYLRWRCQSAREQWQPQNSMRKSDLAYLPLLAAGLGTALGVWAAAWGQYQAVLPGDVDGPTRLVLGLALVPLGLIGGILGRRVYWTLRLHRRYRQSHDRLIQP